MVRDAQAKAEKDAAADASARAEQEKADAGAVRVPYVPEVVKESFHIASTGRPGPVVVDVPVDVSKGEMDFKMPETVNLPGYRPTYKGHTKQLKEAASMISKARKPLFLDESAHDWRMVRLGRELGWTGVALKTCKTQTGAILTTCWAKAHGMSLMVQDLTNPMLAQIPHVLLAAHVGTLMGVETNGMQFYPEASRPEAKVHPGLYQRRGGNVDLSTLNGPGFGYRVQEIQRELPKVTASSAA